MLIGATINGEYIDICLPQNKVEIFLAKLIATREKISLREAEARVKATSKQELRKKYENEIKVHFNYFIERELAKWRNYDSYIKTHKKWLNLVDNRKQ